MTDIIIVGGGPAGLTAALYALRAGKSVLIIEKGAFGGQISFSPKIENYPAISQISGNEFADSLVEQALNAGAEVELSAVVSISGGDDAKIVKTEDGEFIAKAVIIATGAKPKMLGLPREQELIGNGVSFCAVCDGAFYKGRTVAVAGGGNTAMQDAALLSDICQKVYLIHHSATFRGEARLLELLKSRQNVEFRLEESVSELYGERQLEKLVTKNKRDELSEIEVECLFIAIGHEPDNDCFSAHLKLDSEGYALASEDCRTATPGLFVAGDCRAKKIRQLVTACSDGAVAAMAACAYIDAKRR